MVREKKKNGGDEGAPAWVVTYGDMMSLLLTFFIFLFAFSSVDAQEFEAVMDALKAQLGILDGGRTLDTGAFINAGFEGGELASITEEGEFQEMIKYVESYVEEQELGSDVNLELDERGLVIRMTGQVLFDLGKANLNPAGREVLKTIARFLKGIPNDIMIEGHTDDLPINNSEFPNNWVLSSIRATTVISYFIEQRIDPRRLSAAGYSEYKPLVPNTSAANRAKNRRVDIVILKQIQDDEAAGGANHG